MDLSLNGISMNDVVQVLTFPLLRYHNPFTLSYVLPCSELIGYSRKDRLVKGLPLEALYPYRALRLLRWSEQFSCSLALSLFPLVDRWSISTPGPTSRAAPPAATICPTGAAGSHI